MTKQNLKVRWCAEAQNWTPSCCMATPVLFGFLQLAEASGEKFDQPAQSFLACKNWAFLHLVLASWMKPTSVVWGWLWQALHFCYYYLKQLLRVQCKRSFICEGTFSYYCSFLEGTTLHQGQTWENTYLPLFMYNSLCRAALFLLGFLAKPCVFSFFLWVLHKNVNKQQGILCPPVFPVMFPKTFYTDDILTRAVSEEFISQAKCMFPFQRTEKLEGRRAC